MSNNSDQAPDARAVLQALRDQLENWPQQADQLLAHVAQSAPLSDQPDQEDDTLLSLAVDDALKGVDISIRYPAFFQRLLADAALRRDFLAILDAIEGQPISLAAGPQPNLDFLRAAPLQPALEIVSPARWRLIWQAAVDQIQSIFFSAAQFEPIFRSDDDLEDAWFTLFRNEVDIDQAHASVVLEAVRLMAAPDQLQLHLAVGLTPDRATATDRLPDLRAHLIWGGYDQTVIITQRGRATFPPLPLDSILDATAQRITADLQLIVEPAL